VQDILRLSVMIELFKVRQLGYRATVFLLHFFFVFLALAID